MASGRRACVIAAFVVVLALLPVAPAFGVPAGSFTPTGQLNTPRSSPAVAPLPDGRVLVAGGSDGSGSSSTAEVFDPATNAFTPLPNPMTVGRQGAGAALLGDGRVLIAGGYNPSTPTTWLASAEVFNPSTNTFTPVSPMSAIRSVPAAAPLADGRALIAAGFDGNTVPQRHNSAEVFNPATNSFSSSGIGTLSTRIASATAAPLPDGSVLIAGGFDGMTDVKSAELFSPGTGAFTSTGSMGVGREGAAAAPLPDGRVLVAAGFNGNDLQSAEAFDPASGSFSSAGIGDLTVTRNGPGAAPLPDGRVLIVGGLDSSFHPLRSAEVFTLAAPSRTLSFRVRRKRLILEAPVAGTVTVAAASGKKASPAKKGKRRRLLKTKSASGGPGPIVVALKPLGKAKQALRQKGKVRIKATVTFAPKGGGCVSAFRSCYSARYATTQKAKLKIKLKKK
jgi:hypothetical protein